MVFRIEGNDMRKILFIVLMIAFFLAPAFSEEWVISTSQGDKTLVIPEGMTIEEAYQKMAQLYWEERYDREELQDTVATLTKSAEGYISKIEDLETSNDSLLSDYEELVSLYEEKTKVPWVKGVIGADMGYAFDNSMTATLWGGVLLKERVLAEAGIRYPWALTIKLGVVI